MHLKLLFVIIVILKVLAANGMSAIFELKNLATLSFYFTSPFIYLVDFFFFCFVRACVRLVSPWQAPKRMAYERIETNWSSPRRWQETLPSLLAFCVASSNMRILSNAGLMDGLGTLFFFCFLFGGCLLPPRRFFFFFLSVSLKSSYLRRNRFAEGFFFLCLFWRGCCEICLNNQCSVGLRS